MQYYSSDLLLQSVRSVFRNKHSQRRASCNKSVDILQLTTQLQQADISGCVRMACDSSFQQVCCKLSTGSLPVDYLNRIESFAVINLRGVSTKLNW